MMIPELIGVKVLPGGRNTSDWYQSINFILFHTVENVIPLDEHITVSITIHSIIFSLLDAYYRLKSIARHSCNSLKKIILFIFWWNPFGVTPSVWDDNKSERLARAVKDIRGVWTDTVHRERAHNPRSACGELRWRFCISWQGRWCIILVL